MESQRLPSVTRLSPRVPTIMATLYSRAMIARMAQPAADLGRNCWVGCGSISESSFLGERDLVRRIVSGRVERSRESLLNSGYPARDVATLHDMGLAVCPGPFSVLCRAEQVSARRRSVRLSRRRVIVHWTCNRMEQVVF